VSLRVFQVIDGNNCIVELRGVPRQLSSNGFIDSSSPNNGCPVGEENISFWLSGVPTDELSDDVDLALGGVLFVRGNRTYETVAGSRTVLWLERIDVEPHREKFTDRANIKTWTVNGKPLEAVFVSRDGGAVNLATEKGIRKVLAKALSEEDQQIVGTQSAK